MTDLLRHDPKDRQNLNHDLYDDVCQSLSRPDLDIFLKTLEEIFQAAEEVDEGILAGADVLDGLGDVLYCHGGLHDGSRRMLTWKRIPMPAKIAPEGGNTCDTHQRVDPALNKLEPLPVQLRRLVSRRMRTRRSQSERATLSTFRPRFEIDRTPAPGLGGGQEWHWENRRI